MSKQTIMLYFRFPDMWPMDTKLMQKGQSACEENFEVGPISVFIRSRNGQTICENKTEKSGNAVCSGDVKGMFIRSLADGSG
jgi:hypothetical protein